MGNKELLFMTFNRETSVWILFFSLFFLGLKGFEFICRVLCGIFFLCVCVLYMFGKLRHFSLG